MNMRHLLSITLLCSSVVTLTATENADFVSIGPNLDEKVSVQEFGFNIEKEKSQESNALYHHIKQGALGALVVGATECGRQNGRKGLYRSPSSNLSTKSDDNSKGNSAKANEPLKFNKNKVIRSALFGFIAGSGCSIIDSYATPKIQELRTHLYKQSPEFIKNTCDTVQPMFDAVVIPVSKQLVSLAVGCYMNSLHATLMKKRQAAC